MSDKELNINIKTTADTSGADQTTEAIKKTREAAQGASESAEAINQVTDALNNAKTGAEEATQAVVKETEAEQVNTQAAEKNTQSKEKSTSTKRKRKKATEDETKATRDNKKATEEATKAVDKDTKERTENAAALDKQGEALEQTGRKGQQAGTAVAKGSQQGADAVKNMGNGALQAAYFFDDLQYGIRGVMNNIPSLVMGFGGGMGLAGVLSLAVLAGAKLYDWLGDSADKSDDLAKKMKEHNKEIADFLRDAEKQRIGFVQGWKRETAANAINQQYEQYVKNITYEYQQQTREIEYQLTLRKMEIAEKHGADAWKNKMQRLEVEEQYQDGKISKHEREYKLLLLDQELERITEQAMIQTAHEEDLALADKQGDAEGKRDTALGENSRLQNVKMSLPTVEEMSRLFRLESSELPYIIKEIKGKKEAIKSFTDLGGYEDFVKQLRGELSELEIQKYNISGTIEKIKSVFNEESISFQPSYGLDSNGKPITDKQRTEEYKAALEKIEARQKTAVEEAGKHQEELNGILKERVIVQKGILRLETEEARNEQVRKKEAKVGKKEWKREDKKEEEKARKKLEKEQDQELKKLKQEQKRKADEANKVFVKGLTINSGESSSKQQAVIAHKALDAIRGDIERAAADGFIDPVEMREIGKLYAAKLEELGVASRQAIEGLGNQLNSKLGGINAEIKAIKKWANTTERQKRSGGAVNVPFR